MEPASIDFLSDNLHSSGLQDETVDLVNACSSVGEVVKSEFGWPHVRLNLPEGLFPLDGPMHYKTLERFTKESDCRVILFGLGLGHAARALRAAGVEVALIFEPEPGMVRHFMERGPSDLCELPIVTQDTELATIWARAVGDRDNVYLMDTPGYDRAYPEQRARLADKIAELLERNLVNEQTLRVRGKVWVQDILDNSAFISGAPSAHHLQGKYRGVPAFIVGAGPSLGKNIDKLKEAREKGIVFAVNSSGQALDRAGIEPQILACLESVDVSPLIRDLSYIDRVARLFSLSAHPALFRTGTGPLMTLFELIPHIAGPFEALFGRPGMPVCGSVSTICLSLAYRMGCDPIVLVGQDLAYTDGRCYAPGTVYEDSHIQVNPDGKTLAHHWCNTMMGVNKNIDHELLPGQRVQSVPAWGGQGTVTSAGSFAHVRNWFGRIAALLARSDGPELINATEGGARIDNFSEENLGSVLERLERRRITSEELVECARTSGKMVDRESVIRMYRTEQEGAKAVAESAKLMTQSSRAVEAEWQSSDAGLVSQRLRQLQCAEAELKALVARWPWVDAWAWDAVDRALEIEEVDKNISEVLKGIRSEGRLGEAICDAASDLATCLERKVLDLKKN